MTVSRRRLDRTDIGIIEHLQKNARVSNKQLAAAVGIAPSTCHERVRVLVEAGVFRGFHAEVDPQVFGRHLRAMIAVRLVNHDALVVREFSAHVLALQEVQEVYHVAGATDFQVHVVVEDSDHLRSFVLEQLTSRPEVAHVETSLVFEYSRNPVTPGRQA